MGRTEGKKALKWGEAVDVLPGGRWRRGSHGCRRLLAPRPPGWVLPPPRSCLATGAPREVAAPLARKNPIFTGACAPKPPPVRLALQHQGPKCSFFLAGNKKRNYLLCRKGGVCVRLC